METIKQEILSLRSQLAAVQAESPINENKANAITNRISELEFELAQSEAEKAQQEQAHEKMVNEAVSGFDDVVDKMDFGGLALKQIIGGESEYQLVKLEFKKYIQSQADQSIRQIIELQQSSSDQSKASQERERQYQIQVETLQNKVNSQAVELEESNKLLVQERLERANAEQSRNNAASLADDYKQEIERLNSHIDDLRKEIAVGARGAIQVVDTAEEERQKKELADKIRKERTVYNREWVDNIKQNRYKANLAATGEVIEYPWTEQGKYFVIDESEVSQFRQQYAIQPSVEVPDVVETPVQDSANVGGQFPQVQPPAIPTVQSESADGTVVPKTLEDRVAELEAAVFGKAQVA